VRSLPVVQPRSVEVTVDGAKVAVREGATLLDELAQAMRDASICGLGQTASSAIVSAVEKLDVFPEKQP
jgi:NADH-quinone oxidoreductase subunit F